ncbi:DUF2971 domain-containing protein [Lentisphaera marina]|uniref:DUF2971 domain-containing protein n=1 Tax=Lentisphaera marina TaxID=1111041 RepID=UPI0023660D8A|nr:DUF2971 domain-containing protein [Lentisphaera marina]MDD7987056.1 DUF2971 domain-containing protein [Lentisphaera marina]
MEFRGRNLQVAIDENDLDQKEVFHYTSIEALHSIIKTQKIRLSSTMYLNDNLEFALVEELLQEEKLKSYNVEYNKERVDFLNKILDDFKEREAFVCSFSKHSDMLSQWRGYGDNSQGVCIGFKVNEFAKTLQENTKKYRATLTVKNQLIDMARLQLFPVIYDIKEQYKKLNVNQSKEHNENPAYITNHVLWLLSKAVMMKSDSFKEEAEIRLSYFPDMYVEHNKLMINGNLNQLQYRVQDGRLIPYFELPISIGRLLSSITLGPNCRVTERELFRFLRSNNLSLSEDKILRSSSSYKIN